MFRLSELDILGRIVGEATPTSFIFSCDPSSGPPERWEYVIVESHERTSQGMERVFVLAQVEKPVSASMVLQPTTDHKAVERIAEMGVDRKVAYAQARVLGYLSDEGNVKIPRRAIVPGRLVYRAPSDLLKKFFSYGEASIELGSLITRPEVPVSISVQGLRRHLAILAATGAGKSNTAAVLIEGLMEKGATIVILDPHADYVFLGQTQDGRSMEYVERVTIFRNPGSTGRYSPSQILAEVSEFTIKFSDLEPEDLFSMLDLPQTSVHIRGAISKAIDFLKENRGSYTASDLVEKLNIMAEEEKDNRLRLAASSAAERVRQRLLGLPIFGESTTPWHDILRPWHVSVIDLSGVTGYAFDFTATKVLSDIYWAVSSGKFRYPVFLVLEEAHKIVPADRQTHSKRIVNVIASEGRKFGIYLVLISQRPCKIDPDSLSMCQNQIILSMVNPKDQEAVRSAAERVSEELLRDLPGLNVGEAVLVGEFTRVPVTVKIKRRRSKEGGADIDVVQRLKAAKEEAGIEGFEDVDMPRGDEWDKG